MGPNHFGKIRIQKSQQGNEKNLSLLTHGMLCIV